MSEPEEMGGNKEIMPSRHSRTVAHVNCAQHTVIVAACTSLVQVQGVSDPSMESGGRHKIPSLVLGIDNCWEGEGQF